MVCRPSCYLSYVLVSRTSWYLVLPCIPYVFDVWYLHVVVLGIWCVYTLYRTSPLLLSRSPFLPGISYFLVSRTSVSWESDVPRVHKVPHYPQGTSYRQQTNLYEKWPLDAISKQVSCQRTKSCVLFLRKKKARPTRERCTKNDLRLIFACSLW